MRIGIDAHFLSKISQGTGTYSYQLITSLIKQVTEDKLVLLNKDNIVEKWNNVSCLEWGKLTSNYTPYNVLRGYNNIVRKKHLDIIHSNYLGPIFPSKAANIITVHDILFKSHSQFFPKKLRWGVDILTASSFRMADTIIAVSEFTKSQLLHYYPFVKDKVQVVYEAASKDFYPLKDMRVDILNSELGIQKPYILFVGRLAPMKNIDSLVTYYLKNDKIQKEYDLVLVGKFDDSFPNQQLKRKIYSISKIKLLSGIDNQMLNILYNNATLFYFVSNGEGFGLPILEAMSTGCPVLTSNTTACDEIAGNAAFKVSPNSYNEISDAIDMLLGNTSLREQLSQEGIKHAQNYSWYNCAQQTLDIYHSYL